MICNYCGSPIEEGGDFCPVCGAAIEKSNSYNTNMEEVNIDFAPVNDPGSGLGLASLILGIVSTAFGVLCSWCCGGFVPMVCGIIGIILGSVGKKKSAEAGFTNSRAKVGMILSIVGLVICVIIMLISIVSGVFSSILSEAGSSMYY